MTFTIDWSVRADGVLISDVSRMVGVNPDYVKQMFRTGSLGPAPSVAAHVAKIPLHHIAALLIIKDAEHQGVASHLTKEVIASLAAAAIIQLQFTEIAAGRCNQLGGTYSLNLQLWSLLRSPAGRQALAGKLADDAQRPQRYACIGSSGLLLCDDINDHKGSVDAFTVLDAWSVASQMKKTLRGTIFSTHIA